MVDSKRIQNDTPCKGVSIRQWKGDINTRKVELNMRYYLR